jgi:PKD repeat protein
LVEDSVTVIERAAPNAALISSLSMCEGDTAELMSGSNFSSYSWSTGASGSSIQVYETGIYTVTVIGDEGCIGYDTASVNVNPLPQIQFSDSTMCNGAPIVVDAGAFAEYAWNTGDSTSYLSIHTPGAYVVTVVDFNGCESFDTLNVNNTNVTVELPNDTIICENTSLNVQIGNGYDEIEWDDGDDNSYHYIGAEGLHEVVVRIGECTASDQFYVTHDPVVIADFEVNVVSPVVYLDNFSNSLNCLWFFGDGNSSTDFEPQYSYQSNGVFDITLVVENTCGTDTITKEAGIFPQAIGNVGIGQHINVFPTIASSQVHFTISDLNYSNLSYMVYDAAGKIIRQKELQYIGERESVDVSSLASGQYFITIGVDDLSAIHTTTFIVE